MPNAAPIDPNGGMRELVRAATLAANSHDTQPWRFVVSDRHIAIIADFSRRCPAVDPEIHHLFASLGCAAENVVHAVASMGLKATVAFDPAQESSVSIAFETTPLPGWLSRRLLPFIFRESGENAKYAKHIRSSSGNVVYCSPSSDKANLVNAGRASKRFAFEATTLGIKHAFINQPVEVHNLRAHFANYLGIGERRPDLVARFGYGPALPRSSRRTLESVISSPKYRID